MHWKKNIFAKSAPNCTNTRKTETLYKAWVVLTGDQNILAIVKGYQIPFLCQPNREKLPGNINFNQKEKELVSSEKENLLKKVAV